MNTATQPAPTESTCEGCYAHPATARLDGMDLCAACASRPMCDACGSDFDSVDESGACHYCAAKRDPEGDELACRADYERDREIDFALEGR